MSRIVIIGGGAVGLSVAYHLAQRGAQDVLLLERNQLTSGTSWHAAGIVGPLRATPGLTRLASRALTLFPQLEAETGQSTGYRRTGGYWLARAPERLSELHRIADLGVTQGLDPQMIDPSQIRLGQIQPNTPDTLALNLSGLVGALQVPQDGNVNPVDLCMAYAKAARAKGVQIREGTGVARILTQGQRTTGVKLHDGTQIAADTVILCTGAWSRELAATAGVALPLQAVEHMYVVTRPIPDLPDPFPVIRDLDRGIYIKGDAGKLVIGGFEPDAKCWDPYGPEGDRAFLELPEDWDQFAPFMDAALALIPALNHTGIQHFMNGPESFTADTRPLVGETPQIDGLFVAAGMNSVGVMSSAGIGQALADWVADGHPPPDIWEVDVARADPATATAAHMQSRMSEAVADLFTLHWPYKQPTAGRDLRRSALHDRWAGQGAHFGLTAGWERGLWYAQSPSEHVLPYSIGAQPWHPIATREAAILDTGTALLDLSPFTKLELSGPTALDELNQMTTAQMDMPPGTARYTQILNPRGGIEMDITVTRTAPDRFLLVSGAATRLRDLALLRRALSGETRLRDLTEDHCTIGVMGAGSRDVLQALGADLPVEQPFGHSAPVRIANTPCRMTRVSYVGELGWELMIPSQTAGHLFDALLRHGARPMGHFALDGCRIEKRFCHWGHDIGPFLTPLEAGLGFTIDWSRDFIGKAALLDQRAQGLRQRLILLQIHSEALMLHDEPVYEQGRHVGYTTSGARGPRTGLNLAFALIRTNPADTLDDTCNRQFTVRVAGQDSRATPLRHAPFDPKSERMRA